MVQLLRLLDSRWASAVNRPWRGRWRENFSAALPLGLALGLSLPVIALVRPGGLARAGRGWRLALEAVPDGRWAGGWSTAARTAAELQEAAFFEAVRLLLALALVLWIAALAGTVLGSLRKVAAARVEWALRSAIGAMHRQLRARAIAAGLRTSAIAVGTGLIVAAAGCELLARALPASVTPIGSSGAAMLLSTWVVASLIVTVAVVTFIPLRMLPDARSLRRPIVLRAEAGRSDAVWLLAAGQVAACLTIAVSALLLAGGAPTPEETTGLYPHAPDTLVLRVSHPEQAGPRPGSWEAVRSAVRRLPGVQAASVTSPGAILGLGTVDRGGGTCAACSSAGLAMPVMFGRARHLAVDEGFFEVLAIDGLAPSLGGGVVIDTRLRRQWFQGGDAIGQTVWARGSTPLRGPGRRVAGVADVPPPAGLGVGGIAPGGIYVLTREASPRVVDVVVRAAAMPGPEVLMDAIRAAMDGAAPGGGVRVLGRLDELLAEQAAPVLWLARFTAILAIGALLFALFALHAAMLERVRARRAEIGLRIAVGARRRTIIRLVLVDAGQIALAGSLAGSVFGASLNRALPALIGGLEPLRLEPFAALVAILVVTSLLASAGAAARAARMDPVVALRGRG